MSGGNKGKASSSELIDQLRDRVKDVAQLKDGDTFTIDDETLLRFLKAREWDVKESEKQLIKTIEWRRDYKPQRIDCRWCHEKPGCHSMRQVGFDEGGRPVLYSCFSQADTDRNGVEDSIAHLTYLIENATRSMRPGVTNWVFIIDCTGVTLPACNPRLGYECIQTMSTYYPERLGLAICINHSVLFQGVYNAIKVFIHPNTSSKVRLVRGKSKIRSIFETYFSEEMTQWLLTEIKLNKQKNLAPSQKSFWLPPQNPADHDPRGCKSYVDEWIDKSQSDHLPHPNIVDRLMNRLQTPKSLVPPSSGSSAASLESGNNSDEESGNKSSLSEFGTVDIPDEYKIPDGSFIIN